MNQVKTTTSTLLRAETLDKTMHREMLTCSVDLPIKLLAQKDLMLFSSHTEQQYIIAQQTNFLYVKLNSYI